MEYQYIYWRTGPGCLVFMVGLILSWLAVLATLWWLPHNSLVVLVVWAVVFVPMMRLSFQADRRARRRLASRR